MKKIITAIGTNDLNEELKKEEEFIILKNDIPYQEGVIDILNKNQDIDFLIISELLPGKYNIKELINKIKVINPIINIFIILEKENEELEYFLYTKNVLNIFYNNSIEIKDIIEIIKNFNYSIKHIIKHEKPNNNQINDNRNIKSINNNILNIISREQNDKFKIKKLLKNLLSKNKLIEKNNKENNIICISGTCGVGKSIFSVNLAKTYVRGNNKILIIDFDILNNSLHTILGVKKYSKKVQEKIKNNDVLKSLKIEDLVIKINSKIDLISGINLLFDSKYKISCQKIKSILETLKKKYNKIIIDTSSECFFDYTKELMKYSNFNIFITEANLIDIKKSKRLLNIYVNQWQIPKENINILFNKYNKNSIDIEILKQVFSDFKLIGKLDNNLEYNLLINENNRRNLKKELEKEYKKIDKILESIN